MTNTQLGFIGLGAMGFEMASHLQNHLALGDRSPALMVHDLVDRKMEALSTLGCVPTSVSNIAQHCDIIFTSLPNDAVVTQVFDELTKAGVRSSAIVVDCSTVAPATATNLATKMSNVCYYITSPVFGSSLIARDATLLFTPAGDRNAVETCRPFIEGVVGKRVMYLGTDHAQAAKLKICGNTFILGMIQVTAETQVLAETCGISPEFMTEWAQEYGGPGISVSFHKNSTGLYSPRPGDTPMFSVENAFKDINHAENIAAEGHTTVPTLQQLKNNMMKAQGLSSSAAAALNTDVASTYGILRQESGLGFENDAVKKRDQLE